MKYIETGIILCAMLAATPSLTVAQENTQDDVTSSDTIRKVCEERVQVAFRKIDQKDVLGGVSEVDVTDLMEKNYFTYSMDNMSGLVGGYHGNMWGMDGYMVMVDGVPRDVNNVNPSEIEKITFLKGASAVVLYGSRAAKGVVYITTKRGSANVDKEIQVRANTGWNVNKSYPKYLGSAEYMTLYNEACLNDNKEAQYTDEAIYNYASGRNPYRFPDLDFYSSDYIKNAYNRTDVTAEISGGGERARFYTNINYYNVGSQFKFGEAESDYTSRFSVRGNIDLKLNDWISAYVNATTTFYSLRTANGNYWENASTLCPNKVSPLIPISYLEENDEASWILVKNSNHLIDGKYLLGGNQSNLTNPFADIYASGYNKYTSRQFQFDAGVNIDLSKVLSGLSFGTQFSVDYATTYNSSFNNDYAIYDVEWSEYNGKDVISSMTKRNEDKKTGIQNIKDSWNKQTVAFSAHFDYNRTFSDVHNVSAILVANGFQQSETEAYHKQSNANLGLQVDYNYANKYYLTLGGALIHSAKLPENNREAFSPSATLGWRLSKEDFLSGSSVVDDLLVSASGSVLHSDLDIEDYYMYEGIYSQTEGDWWGWRDGALERTTKSLRGSNPDLSFIKRKEFSVNVKASLWERFLTVDASFFTSKMEGLLAQPTTYPSYFSKKDSYSMVPYINSDDNKRIGFDFDVKAHKRFGEVDMLLGVCGTWYDTEATKRSEIYADAYQNRVGKPIDALWGLKSAGFYADEAEINSGAHSELGSVQPGDIKYIDQNGDNKIDSKDEVYLGRAGWNGSPLTLGVNVTAKYKNFTLFVLGTGKFGAYALKDGSYWKAKGEGKYSEVVRGRWTENTAATAIYPRLTTGNGSNNYHASDFWLYKTDRFDLARVQLTYDFPKSLLKKCFINELSAYVSGSDLLTIAKERKILEMNIGNAPQTRFYNVGVKAVF